MSTAGETIKKYKIIIAFIVCAVSFGALAYYESLSPPTPWYDKLLGSLYSDSQRQPLRSTHCTITGSTRQTRSCGWTSTTGQLFTTTSSARPQCQAALSTAAPSVSSSIPRQSTRSEPGTHAEPRLHGRLHLSPADYARLHDCSIVLS